MNWTLEFMVPKNWIQPKPSIERLIELENYVNYHGLRCVLDTSFTNMEGTIVNGKPKKIRKYIKRTMKQEFKNITKEEIDLIYHTWVDTIMGHKIDIILVKKYERL